MLAIEVTVSDDDSDYVVGDRAEVFVNVDEAGMAAGEPTTGATPVPVDLFPGLPAGESTAGNLAVRVPIGPVCFGRLKVAVRAVDSLGNPQAGAMASIERTVNSPPRPVGQVRRGEYAGGQQAVGYRESPQLTG